MCIAGHHLTHTREEPRAAHSRDLGGCIPSGHCRIVPHLTIIVIAPTPDRAIRPDGTGMTRPGSNLVHSRKASRCTEPDDLNWRGSLDIRAVPYLSVAVIAPTIGRAIRFDDTRMPIPSGDLTDSRHEISSRSAADNLSWHVLLERTAVPQLTRVIGAPTIRRIVYLSNTCVSIPTCAAHRDLSHVQEKPRPSSTDDLDRRIPLGRTVIPQLTRPIRPPAEERAIHRNRTRAAIPGYHLADRRQESRIVDAMDLDRNQSVVS